MDISLHVLRVEVMGKQTQMTLKIAKQFPIMPANVRMDLASNGKPAPEPICKINAHTLGSIGDWLYLVEDAEAGLAWQHPFTTLEEYALAVISKGGWVDYPEQVRTIILM